MDAAKDFIKMVMPLALLGLASTIASSIVAGPLSIGLLTFPQVFFLANFLACFLLILLLLFVIESARSAPRFVNQQSQHLDVKALWQSLSIKPAMLIGTGVVTLTVLSINGNANLLQIYRTSTTAWCDRFLWNVEEPVFRAIMSSHFRFLPMWEFVYYMMWIYVLLVLSALVKNRRTESYMTFAIAIVLAFYCTTLVALNFPVAGPRYYRPELFGYLDGSLSMRLQDLLRDYQLGKIAQNGLFYGTMAMPSLHVGLTAIATWFVALHWRRALWIAIPCALLIWISTVVLAWHYALDGLAALAMAWLCIVCARKIVRLSQKLTAGH